MKKLGPMAVALATAVVGLSVTAPSAAGLLEQAVMSDICGSTSVGQETNRLIESGLATVAEVTAAIPAAEAKCPMVHDVESYRLGVILKASTDMSKPISYSRRVQYLYSQDWKGAWIYTSAPRIFALAQYYSNNQVRENDTAPLRDSVAAWVAQGGDPNARACDGTSLAEVLVTAQAPNSLGVIGGAGANFNIRTTVSKDSSSYLYSAGSHAPTEGLININFKPYDVFAFGDLGDGRQYRTNDCVSADDLPETNLTLFEFAFARALSERSKFSPDSIYGAMLDALITNGAKFDHRVIHILASHGSSFLSYQKRGLEYLIDKGFDINAEDPNGNTLASLVYGGGGDAETIRYLIGLGAVLE